METYIMKSKKCVYILLFSFSLASAQGLFESAEKNSETSLPAQTLASNVDLSGYVRGALFYGQNSGNDAELKAAYADVSLKLNARKSNIGKAFGEVRLVSGTEYGSPHFSPDVREAWVSATPGLFDITLGKKIIAWGRADGINPTNRITPMNSTAFSSELDDTRQGNFLAQASFSWFFLRFEGIWLPLYAPDVLPIGGADLPSGITITDPAYPGSAVENSGFAVRCDLSFPSVDGSLSYFNGYETQPGFNYTSGLSGFSLIPAAYRIHMAGVDFSTAIGPFGVRGEAAVVIPFDNPEKKPFIPSRHAAFVLGIDRSISSLNLLVQYAGVYVPDFRPIPQPVLRNPADIRAQMEYLLALGEAEIISINRLFTQTADRASHSVTAHIGWRGLYETLRIDLAGQYNFTTEEYVINPAIAYDIADALCVTVGGRYLRGPAGSRNDLVDDMLSHVYAELKLSF